MRKTKKKRHFMLFVSPKWKITLGDPVTYTDPDIAGPSDEPQPVLCKASRRRWRRRKDG